MRHPLLQHYSVQRELALLLKNDPEQFLAAYTAAKNNMIRYQSYIANMQKGSPPQREGWQAKLDEYTEKARLMSLILREATTS